MSNGIDLHAALSEAETKELRQFFEIHRKKNDGFSLEEAHGYLAGIICGPNIIPAQVWLADLFNGDATFEDEEHGERIISFIIRLYNTTADVVQDEGIFSKQYFPAHPSNIKNHFNAIATKEWCRGFMVGSSNDLWLNVEDYRVLSFPFMALTLDDDEDLIQEIISEQELSIDQLHKQFASTLMQRAIEIYEYFQDVKHEVNPDIINEEIENLEDYDGDIDQENEVVTIH